MNQVVTEIQLYLYIVHVIVMLIVNKSFRNNFHANQIMIKVKV